MTARPTRRPTARRRGVTLVEMLVTVGLLVLVMTILVQIFRSATGALSAQRAFAGLDQDIRRVDAFLRQDLAGTTAKMTPPNNPRDGTGYFTYGENALADLQGEDTDDYLAFTAKAPEGRPFTGTMVVPSDQRNATTGLPLTYKRVPISSDFAEIVYFLRNGNLYRRVFLILPRDQQGAVNAGVPMGANGWGYDGTTLNPSTGLYNLPAGWLGLNDLSARPSAYPPAVGGIPILPAAVVLPSYAPRLNTLADLTNRENRAFNPRFANDYVGYDAMGALVAIPDGIPDDLNGDGVPDYYPTMYPNLGTRVGVNPVVNELVPYAPPIGAANYNTSRLGFPFAYPNPYSRYETFSIAGGAMHSLDPATPFPVASRPALGSYRDPLYNHGPLDLDDPLGAPVAGQTWWGFPTKKETLSSFWTDPVKRLNDPSGTLMTALGTEPAFQQSLGLRHAFLVPAASRVGAAALPPMTDALRGGRLGQPFAATGNTAGDTTPAGVNSFTPGALPAASQPTNPEQYFQAFVEEDLILSGVRSFDVKAYDPSLENYVDLGFMNMYVGTPATVDVDFDGVADFWTMRTFAHEGRMPPLTTDYRSDPQAPAQNPNVGDDATTVVRLRRVWDSWSTDYTNTPVQMIGTTLVTPQVKPALPSYPPPYPLPLRGIQITVRVVDPGNERVKQLTIRQDFSSKL